jgi:hypothetical protein
VGDDETTTGRVIGVAGPGERGYVESDLNADGGEAAVDLEHQASQVASGEADDPAVANADPARVHNGELLPPD